MVENPPANAEDTGLILVWEDLTCRKATEPALQGLCFMREATARRSPLAATHTHTKSPQAAVKAQHNQLNNLKIKTILCDR